MQERRLGSKYVLTDLLGRGAMGQVYRARVEAEGAGDVAVKILRDDLGSDPDLVSRFLQEGRLLKSVDHPNVVRIRDLVAEGDELALVMDLVDGGDLRRAVPMPCSLRDAARIAAGLAEGLAAVHAAGITHRDLKPENVLVEHGPDNAVRPRIADFGVSRFETAATTRRGMTGTVGYIAPEVAKGGSATPASDVYSLGVILYELCVGHGPFRAEHPIALIRAHAEDPVPRPELMPDGLWRLVEQILAKDPAERPGALRISQRLSELAGTLPETAAAVPAVAARPTPGTESLETPTAEAPQTLPAPPPGVPEASAASAASAVPGAPGGATVLRPEGPRPPIVTPPAARGRRPLPAAPAAAVLVAAAALVTAAAWLAWPSREVAARSGVVLGAASEPIQTGQPVQPALPAPPTHATRTTTRTPAAPARGVPAAPTSAAGRLPAAAAQLPGHGPAGPAARRSASRPAAGPTVTGATAATGATGATGASTRPGGPPAAAVAVPAAPAPAATTSTSQDPRQGTSPLHRYWNAATGDHFYTTNYAELGGGAAGYVYEGVQAYVYPAQAAGSVPLHRYWNAATGDHFYTTNYAELGGGAAGYVYEGVQAYVR